MKRLTSTLIATVFALAATASFAQDGMKKDAMAKDGMKKDAMSKDAMKK